MPPSGVGLAWMISMVLHPVVGTRKQQSRCGPRMRKFATGRRTHRGIEVCEYFDRDTPQEKIAVIAWTDTEVDAEVICQALEQTDKQASS